MAPDALPRFHGVRITEERRSATARALSLHLRERVVAAIEAGASCGRAAERFCVVNASAIRWHARYRTEREIAAKPMNGDRHPHRTEAHAAMFLQAYEAQSQTSLREVGDLCRRRAGPLRASATCRVLSGAMASHAIGALPAADASAGLRSPPDVMQAREAWFEGQLDLDPQRVVVLDETATATPNEMALRPGRRLRCTRPSLLGNSSKSLLESVGPL